MAKVFDTPLFSSDQSVDRVLNSGLPVVLVFVDGQLLPGIDQAMKKLAKEKAGALFVVQIHPKDSPETAKRYAIHGMPALVTIKAGQVQSQAENFAPGELESHANYLLGKGPRPEVKQQAQYGTSYSGSGSSASGAAYNQAQTSAAYTQEGHTVSVTDATFEQEVMRSPIPVVVDFWAPWCGPCRMVAPVLDKLAREWNGQVKIAKVNVDENPVVAGQHGVRGIPTMMVVANGRIIDTWAGALPEPQMRSRLSAALKQKA